MTSHLFRRGRLLLGATVVALCAFAPATGVLAAWGHPAPLPAAAPFEQPPRVDPATLRKLVAATFPEDSARALRILACESSDGRDPDTYNLFLDNGGPLQINRWWEPYFHDRFGWSWSDLVNNIDIHLRAARIVYDDAHGWSPWECYTSGKAR